MTRQSSQPEGEERGILSYIARVPFLNMALLVTMTCSLMGYLAMNTRTATKGFMVRALEQNISELEEAQNNLNLEIVSKQSMENVQKVIEAKGYIPVQDVQVIEKKEAPVAAR